jgi:hypothetical protein
MGGDTLSAPMFWSVLEGEHHGRSCSNFLRKERTNSSCVPGDDMNSGASSPALTLLRNTITIPGVVRVGS